MNRREIIALLGGAEVAWPFGVRSQNAAMPVIGFLGSGFPETTVRLLAGFRQGLLETGYTEGQNVGIEYRWQEGRVDRLPTLLADLIRHQVAMIIAGGAAAAQAAKAATTTIPVVFTSALDPVAAGLVESFNRPGHNLTGVSLVGTELTAKRFELLHEILPTASKTGFLVNPDNVNAENSTRAAKAAAQAIGHRLVVVQARALSDFRKAFASMREQQTEALCVAADALFFHQRKTLAALATGHGIPAVSDWPEFTMAGGLISYGAALSSVYRQVGVYTGRILNGTNPADLPIEQPTEFELVINRKTANSLGLAIPESFLLRADEVIE